MRLIRLRGIWVVGSASLFVVALSTSQSPTSKPQAKPASGEAIFAKECAPCHGAKGVGGAAYPRQLLGDKSVNELSNYIAKSMPPGPKKTPKPNADLLAKYMHEDFYSPVAQERVRPPRVAMARLTVRQFRNALADLLGPDRQVVNGEPGGLTGSYYKGHVWDKSGKLINRVDPTVNFDFGTKGPGTQGFDLHNYSIVWEGSVYAPETGDYEFIIRSNQPSLLHVNGWRKPLIDARVRSTNENEMKATTFLIGGRSYPIVLSFTKTTTGVNDDEKKKKTPPGPANVQLLWKRPKLSPELIPPQYLIPTQNAETYVCETAFPADDRSIGYERGTAMSKEWDDATTQAALAAADYALGLLGKQPNTPEKTAKLKEASKQFLIRAFRQPLTPELQQVFLEKQFAATPDPEIAMKRVMLLGLKSPRFLYREIGNRKDAFQTAAELAFGMWDTIPDSELLRAAGAGELKSADGVRRQATRMVENHRAWNKLRDFLMMWLKVDETPDIIKSSKAYPGFDQTTVTDLRTSLDMFLQDAAWGKDGSYQKLLLSKTQFLNGRLASIYGANVAANATFQPVNSPDRVGVLTQPYLLSRLSYLEGTSPIHRGVLIARNMMGRLLAAPPSAVAPVASSLHPTLSTRERVDMQTKPEACNGCHSLINPLGFTLEKYDAIGRVRTTDNNKPINTTGGYQTPDGVKVKFANADELAQYIATSEDAQKAFVEKLFQHMTKQPIRAYGKNALPNLHAAFKNDNFRIKGLMVSILMTTFTEQAKQ